MHNVAQQSASVNLQLIKRLENSNKPQAAGVRPYYFPQQLLDFYKIKTNPYRRCHHSSLGRKIIFHRTYLTSLHFSNLHSKIRLHKKLIWPPSLADSGRIHFIMIISFRLSNIFRDAKVASFTNTV